MCLSKYEFHQGLLKQWLIPAESSPFVLRGQLSRAGTRAFDVVLDLSWGSYSFSKTSFSSKKLNLKNSVTLDSAFYYQIKAKIAARKEGSQIEGGGGER